MTLSPTDRIRAHEWYLRGKRGGCVVCKKHPVDDKTRRDYGHEIRHIQVHHGLRQQDLKAKGLDLWDHRLAVGVCEYHHRGHTSRMRRIPADALPPALLEYVAEYDLDNVLQREYPDARPTAA